MRRIMWFSIGFAIACGLCAYCLPDTWIVPLLAGAFAVSIVFAIFGHGTLLFRRLAYCCIGCAVGLGWFLLFRGIHLMPAIELDGTIAAADITASDYSYETTYGTAFDGTTDLKGRTYQVRVYLNGNRTIEPGDRVHGEFRFRVTTPDGTEEATYHQGKGIFLLAYQKGEVSFASAGEVTLREYPAVLRQQIQEMLRSCFPEDVFPFVQALLLGDSTELDYETDTAFKVSGIRHIIAVSGLHVSILYGLLSALTFKRRFLTAMVSMPVLLLFAAVAGFTPSVTRACIMVCLMIVATAFNREYDGATALSFACFVMLIGNPLVITSVSLQLSALSVAGIFLFYEGIQGWLKTCLGSGKGRGLLPRLKRWFTSSVAVTLSATSLTTPLCAYYFGTVSLIGVLTNLLTLWAVSVVFYGIIGTCVLYLLSASLAKILAEGISWMVRYILFTAKCCARIPMAAVYTASIYIVIWLVFLYLLLTVFLLSRKRKPGRLLCCGIIGLCIALLASWAEPLTDDCRVTVLDVGQGQSILLQCESHTFLVDCGGDRDTEAADIAVETLLSQGITQLDGVILTHGDADHAGGVQHLLTRIDTDLLILAEEAVRETLSPLTKGSVIFAETTLELTFGQGKITVFGPIYSGESNENSLCVLFETENCAILITGDRSEFGERMLLRSAALPDIDLLIAGHHGSKYSTSEELLVAVCPETVIISVGENSYGHPAPELLKRLEVFGCTVYRTDECGTIIYRR